MRIDEILIDDKALLKLSFGSFTPLMFRHRCNTLKKLGTGYQRLRWQNQYQNIYDEFEDIREALVRVLGMRGLVGNKNTDQWLHLIRLLLPKIDQAMADLQNHSWQWLTINF